MKLNKQVQYGLLLALYLYRSGKTTVANASEGLKVSNSFLVQIANKLKKAGVIISSKGPTGGYSLVEDTTVRDVINALQPLQLLTKKEIFTYATGELEHRALAYYIENVSKYINSLLNKKIKDVEKEVNSMELAYLNRMVSTVSN